MYVFKFVEAQGFAGVGVFLRAVRLAILYGMVEGFLAWHCMALQAGHGHMRRW